MYTVDVAVEDGLNYGARN